MLTFWSRRAGELLRWFVPKVVSQDRRAGHGGLEPPPDCSRQRVWRQGNKGGVANRLSHKSVIMVYLSGGLAHQDTFDLKPEAPAGIRGEFKPIDDPRARRSDL